jgi:FkbM family methyltransferase
MLIWNYYAPQLRAVVQRILRRGDVFIDVGANMGYFSTLGATLVGPSGRVIAIEPDPQALALLRANLELNASPIVDVLEAAAGGASGDLSFHVSSQLGWSSAISHAGMMVAQTISVPVVTIDAVVSDHLRGRTPRLLKADVEGFEPEVLRGAARLLSSSSTAFLLEVNTLGLRAGGSAFSDLFEVFSRHRYDVHWVHGQSGMVQALGSPRLERVTDPLDFAERDGDILALPAGWGRL